MTLNIEEKLSGWLTPAIASSGYPSEWYKARADNIRSIVHEAPIDRTIALVSVFLEVATPSQIEEISKLIQAEDLSYDRGNAFLNRLIAGACLIESLNSRDVNADAIALAASTYSLQQKAFDSRTNLVESDFFEIAGTYLANEMRLVRPELEPFKKTEEYNRKAISTAAIKKTIETISDGTVDKNAATLKALTEITEHLGRVQSEVIERVNELITSANSELKKQHNQITIAREESNLLWWLFGEFSRDEDKPFSEFGMGEALLRLGKESADLTEIPPGHVAAKGILHKAIMLMTARGEPSSAQTLSFSEILGVGTPAWLVDDKSRIIPFCHVHRAIGLKNEVGGDGWIKAFEQSSPFKTSQKFSFLDISYQVYQECLLISTVSE